MSMYSLADTVVILSCVQVGFASSNSVRTRKRKLIRLLQYLMKCRVLPHDTLYLERRLPIFIVLSLRFCACEIALPYLGRIRF